MMYVWYNIKSYIKKEPIVFLLMSVCVIASAIVILFSFGLYHHMEQKKIDARFGRETVYAEFYDDTYKTTTKKAVIKACEKLPQDVLEQCYFCATARLPGEEKIDNYDVDLLATMFLYYEIHNGTVTVADIGEQWKKDGSLTSGEWFRAEQVENGDLVCIAMDPNSTYAYSGEADELYGKQFEVDENGECTVGGKKYVPIGYMRGGPMPIVPITTLEDDIYISSLTIVFDHVVSRKVHDSVAQVFEEYFGKNVYVSKIAVPDVDAEKLYGTIMFFCVAMAVLSGIVLAVLYEYVLLQRARKLAIFRLCGLSLKKARRMFLAECMLICTVSFFVSVLFFHVGLVPEMQRVYEYIGKSYTIKTYIMLGILYMGTTLMVISGMLRLKLHENVIRIKCE